MEIVGLQSGMTLEELARTARELVARNHRLLAPGDDLALSVFVTPGEFPPTSHNVSSNISPPSLGEGTVSVSPLPEGEGTCEPPTAAHPNVCLHTYPLPFHRWAARYREGQALATTAVEQVSPHCWPPSLKCRSRMHYYLADRQAAARDPQARALLLDAQGFVTEASTANLVIYRAGGGLAWPPTKKVLPGISLAVVAELAQRLGIPHVERDLTLQDVASAHEAFLSSTPFCLVPATRLNGQPIGTGRPGELFGRLIAAWSDMVGVDIIGQAEQYKFRG